MKLPLTKPASATALLLALGASAGWPPSQAQADEVWQNDTMFISWLDEGVQGHAVFEYTQTDPATGEVVQQGKMFIEGLDSATEERGTYQGYWMIYDTAEPYCPGMPKTDAYGETSESWGTLEVTFDRPTFPSGWTAKMGACDEPAGAEFAVMPPPDWVNETTEVFWYNEGVEGHSVFGFVQRDPATREVVQEGQMFIEGLGFADEGGGTYPGYWMVYDAAEPFCPGMPKTDVYGVESESWGNLELTVGQDPALLSGWTASMGACDEPAETELTVLPPG